ncbi:MAG: hypothetical protein Q9222_003789 [Ikaeria aurantiellina]
MASRRSKERQEGREARAEQHVDPTSAHVPGSWQQEHLRLGFDGPGFKNLGNRCYLNSVIIALFHLPRVVNWLELHLKSKCEVENQADCLAHALGQLSRQYWHNPPNSEALEVAFTNFGRVICRIESPWSAFQEKEQQDAHEFLEWLLSRLQEQSERTAVPTRESEFFDQLFLMFVVNASICAECGEPGNAHNPPIHHLNLPCDGMADIDQVTKDYFTPVSFSGQECGSKTCKKRKVIKHFTPTIIKGPDVLCTQFRRFRTTVKGQSLEQKEKGELLAHKIKDEISYGEILDLSRHCFDKLPLRYRLFATVHHCGELENGHYINVTRNINDKDWKIQDDLHVGEGSMKKALNNISGFTPYLLFWQKIPQDATFPPQPPLSQPIPPPDIRRPSPPSRGTRKRPLEVIEEDTEPSISQSPPKTPRRSKSQDASSTNQNTPSRFSKIWPPAWLYGNDPAMQQALADCEAEHAKKDELIEQYRQLVKIGGRRYTAFALAVSSFAEGLNASEEAMQVFSGLMMKLSKKDKYQDRALNFLSLEMSMKSKRKEGIGKFRKLRSREEQKKGGTENIETWGILRGPKAEEMKDAYRDLVDKDIEVPWVEIELSERGDAEGGGVEVVEG